MLLNTVTLWVNIFGCSLASRNYTFFSRHEALFITFCIAAQPNWIQKTSDTRVAIEESIFWECKASGRPKPSYSWLKDGEPLMPQVRKMLKAGDLVLWRTRLAECYIRILLLWQLLFSHLHSLLLLKSKCSHGALKIHFLCSGFPTLLSECLRLTLSSCAEKKISLPSLGQGKVGALFQQSFMANGMGNSCTFTAVSCFVKWAIQNAG